MVSVSNPKQPNKFREIAAIMAASTGTTTNMSRSNPNEVIPNPCTRWFDWRSGGIQYFDKEAKKNVKISLPFEFILLDKLSTVTGWSDENESGIYANEVKDTRNEPFVVKAFKRKEPIAEGFYSDIRDTIIAAGGKFTTNLYIAYTGDDDNLALGSLKLHASALRQWMEFENDKAVKPNLYKGGIKIAETKTGKKGGITFVMPVFELVELPKEINDQATEIDSTLLQPYLKSYFQRTRIDQAQPHSSEHDINQELSTTRHTENEDQTRQDADDLDF